MRALSVWVVYRLGNILCFLTAVAAYGQVTDIRGNIEYRLFVGTIQGTQTRPGVISVGSSNLSKEAFGSALIWINGNPLSFYDGSAVMIPVNQWVCPGSNSLHISGNTDSELYVKVAAFKGGALIGNYQETTFSGKQLTAGNSDPWKFFVKAEHYPVPCDGNHVISDHDAAKAGVRSFLLEMNQLILANKRDELLGVLLKGPLRWQEDAYGTGKKDLEAFRLGVQRFWNDSKRKIKPLNLESVEIIVGKTSALAYIVDDRGTPFLIETEFMSRSELLPPLRLVKHKGEWVVWQ